MHFDLRGKYKALLAYTDYYSVFNSREVTELNLLKDSYFVLNSFEFFVVNFSLLFGFFEGMWDGSAPPSQL